MKTDDFRKGERVRFIPYHARGEKLHSDCKNGVVTSVNDNYVFVKYDTIIMKMVTGDEPYTAQATNPEDLIKEQSHE